MEFTPGTILEGTVRSITAFGAFVELPEGKSGLVHISEVAASYVTDIHQFLTEGQSVRVKILRTDERGRLSLSIKQAAPRQTEPARSEPRPARRPQSFRPVKAEPESFEEKLKQFMSDSNSKISGVRQYEHKTRSRKR